MKIFARIVYALFMVTLFWFTINTASNMVTERYIEEQVQPDLDSSNPDYLYFFNSVPTYNHRSPIYSLDTENISIRFYEIVVKKGNALDEYVYVLFHNRAGFDNTLDHYLAIEGFALQPVEYPQGQIFDVLVMVNLEQVYIPKSLIEANFNKVWSIKTVSEIEDEEDQTVFSFTPTQEKPFEVKAALLDYQEAYGELPKKELESNHIYYYAQPDYSKYFIVYTTALSIYGVVFAVSLIGLMVYDLKKKKA